MGSNPAFKVVGYYIETKLRKNNEFVEVVVNVKNISDKCWWDGRDVTKLAKHCLKVEPIVVGTLNDRYFETMSAGRYKNQPLFSASNVLQKLKREPTIMVLPGQTTKLRVFIKAKDYTPVATHSVLIGLRERQSKEELEISPKSKPISLKVIGEPYHDNRMTGLKDIGVIDEYFENQAFVTKQKSSKDQAVVMAVWKRIERLNLSIAAIEGQKGISPILYLWVNNRQFDDKIKNIVKKSSLPIKVYFSKNNIGGFGRFYLSKDIVNQHKSVIYIDDDQIPAPNAFSQMKSKHKPKSIYGVYATRTPIKTDYWVRDEIKPGESADYIGTGGMICDTSIFKDEKVFKCPRKYWFVEDLWLCYYAKSKLSWKLIKSAARIDTIDDKKDQFQPMINLKNEFYRYLLKRKMRIHERSIE